MNEEKQIRENAIEEMARDIFEPRVAIDGIDIAFAAVHGADRDAESHFMRIARHLYKKGYRKQSEVASDILTQIYKEAGNGDECYGIRVKVVELAKKYNAKFKQEVKFAPMAIYRGFCSHDCEAHYACPVCGGGFGSWRINNNDVRCPHCKAELRLPR